MNFSDTGLSQKKRSEETQCENDKTSFLETMFGILKRAALKGLQSVIRLVLNFLTFIALAIWNNKIVKFIVRFFTVHVFRSLKGAAIKIATSPFVNPFANPLINILIKPVWFLILRPIFRRIIRPVCAPIMRILHKILFRPLSRKAMRMVNQNKVMRKIKPLRAGIYHANRHYIRPAKTTNKISEGNASRNLALSVVFVIFGVSLSACGFQPVYSTGGSQAGQGATSLAAAQEQIRINVIPDREGQYLRNVLIDRLNRGGYPSDPRYVLSIDEINESLRNLDVTIDSDTTRGQFKAQTTMKIMDLKGSRPVASRQLHAITSYNILDSEFANSVSEQTARENALNDLASQIVLQVNLYLRRR